MTLESDTVRFIQAEQVMKTLIQQGVWESTFKRPTASHVCYVCASRGTAKQMLRDFLLSNEPSVECRCLICSHLAQACVANPPCSQLHHHSSSDHR